MLNFHLFKQVEKCRTRCLVRFIWINPSSTPSNGGWQTGQRRRRWWSRSRHLRRPWCGSSWCCSARRRRRDASCCPEMKNRTFRASTEEIVTGHPLPKTACESAASLWIWTFNIILVSYWFPIKCKTEDFGEMRISQGPSRIKTYNPPDAL